MIDNILMIKNDAQERKKGWISGHGNISNQVKLSRAFVRDDSGNDCCVALDNYHMMQS